jgi:hypothetical protein
MVFPNFQLCSKLTVLQLPSLVDAVADRLQTEDVTQMPSLCYTDNGPVSMQMQSIISKLMQAADLKQESRFQRSNTVPNWLQRL